MYVLTREDARQRSASIKVRHIDVSLDLSGATRESHFPVCSHMTLVTATPDLFIDCAGIVQQVSVNGIAVPYTHDGERIDLHELPTDQEITISVDAQCRYSTTGEGLHRYRDPEDGRYTSTHNLNQKTLTGHGRVLTSLTSSPSGHSM